MVRSIHIGVGLGGCKFAKELSLGSYYAEGKENAYYMNISSDELDVILMTVAHGQRVLVGDGAGAGKDRALALELFSQKFNLELFISRIAKKVQDDKIGLITVAFSTGGGTGSGIGPMLTNLVTNFMSSTKGVSVMGIALLPSFNEGIGVFRNTVLAINDINKSIRGGSRFTLVENNSLEHGGSFIEKREYVNKSSASIICDYIKPKNDSFSVSVLDDSDRRMGLNFVGLHSFSRLKDYEVKPSCFIAPHAAKVKHLMAEIPEENCDMYENQLTANTVNLDFKYGYTKRNEGVVAYHGFMSLLKETIPYRKRFDELKELDKETDLGDGSSLVDLKSEVFNYSAKLSNSKIELESSSVVLKDLSNNTFIDRIAEIMDNKAAGNEYAVDKDGKPVEKDEYSYDRKYVYSQLKNGIVEGEVEPEVMNEIDRLTSKAISFFCDFSE